MSNDSTLQQWQEKYIALETRQRAMAITLVIAILLVLIDSVWFRPITDDTERLRRDLVTAQTERDQLLSQNEQYQRELTGSALTGKRRQLEQLRQRVAKIDQSLGVYAQLVTPREMPELLRSFFKNSKPLTLVALEKRPVKPAFETLKPNAKQVAENVNQPIKFYRHEFSVKLRGNYFDLLKSLRQLEAKNVKIYWDGLTYQVDSYPRADIELVVYTFSYADNWIGA